MWSTEAFVPALEIPDLWVRRSSQKPRSCSSAMPSAFCRSRHCLAGKLPRSSWRRHQSNQLPRHGLWKDMGVWYHIFIFTLVFSQTRAHTHIISYHIISYHIYIYIDTDTHTYTHKYTHTHIYIYIHIHTYIHPCIHTYTHTYIHTYRKTEMQCDWTSFFAAGFEGSMWAILLDLRGFWSWNEGGEDKEDLHHIFHDFNGLSGPQLISTGRFIASTLRISRTFGWLSASVCQMVMDQGLDGAAQPKTQSL